jgi:hypothetical protein
VEGTFSSCSPMVVVDVGDAVGGSCWSDAVALVQSNDAIDCSQSPLSCCSSSLTGWPPLAVQMMFYQMCTRVSVYCHEYRDRSMACVRTECIAAIGALGMKHHRAAV